MTERIVVTLREAAEILHRPINSLRVWLYNGDRIKPADRDGRTVRFYLDDLRVLNEKHRPTRADTKLTAAKRELDRMMRMVMAGENPAGPMKRAKRNPSERPTQW